MNFLFDPTQTPHIHGRDLCALFNVSQSAGSAKAREIMRLLNIVQLDPRWGLPSRLADNPLVWMIDERHRRRCPDDAARVSRRSAPSRPDSVRAGLINPRASLVTAKSRHRHPFIGE